MRLTQFSVFLSVLASQSSILSNINGQHGCSNTELYLCSSISSVQSEISSELQRVVKFSLGKKTNSCYTFKCCSCPAVHTSLALLWTFSLFRASIRLVHNRYADAFHSLVTHSRIPVKCSTFLVGQDVCLTHSNISWHTLIASSGTLCEGHAEHTDELG